MNSRESPRVLVSGGTGYIGENVLEMLHQQRFWLQVVRPNCLRDPAHCNYLDLEVKTIQKAFPEMQGRIPSKLATEIVPACFSTSAKLNKPSPIFSLR